MHQCITLGPLRSRHQDRIKCASRHQDRGEHLWEIVARVPGKAREPSDHDAGLTLHEGRK